MVMADLWDAEWYDKEYHGDKMSPELWKPPGLLAHGDRDRAFYRQLGVGPGKRVLECGCGGCNGLWVLQEEFGCDRLTAFDFSRVAMEYCRHWMPRVTAWVGSAEHLESEDGTFDIVVVKDFTEHLMLNAYFMFLREVCRVLAPRGVVGVLPGMTLRHEHINILPPITVAHHLVQAGLEVTEVTKHWVIAVRGEDE